MLALIYLGLAISVGDRLCGRFFRFVSTAHRWATGTLVGLMLSTSFTYLAARHFASASNPLLLGDFLFLAAALIFLAQLPAEAPAANSTSSFKIGDVGVDRSRALRRVRVLDDVRHARLQSRKSPDRRYAME